MDELVFLNLLEGMEAAEENVGGQQESVVVIQHAEDIGHLTNEQFRKLFCLSREAFNFLVDLIEPHLNQPVKNTDISATVKVRRKQSLVEWWIFQILQDEEFEEAEIDHDIYNNNNEVEGPLRWINPELAEGRKVRTFATYTVPGNIIMVSHLFCYFQARLVL
ncbi:dna-directed rna polymerases i ii and iii subunit rpabc2 [Holotrichia oblita]|uniref:Dna-directed rna polymerases i ii and iii subunit rpabc2 n=1 Tax=Holotrichia oblita TaxID=644536 RepID=A0ACB9SK79_HOLOL|nr:dna-directed rna polymerases i ii and iii subunit rpabc2 [Holotrichia oblita]